MIEWKRPFNLAPDAGGGAGYVEETLPDAPQPEAEDTVDYLYEGSPEAAAAVQPELAGKSREDILAELRKAQDEVTAERAKADPVVALTETLNKVLRPEPQRGPVQPGYLTPAGQAQQPLNPYATETPEQRKQRINDHWLSDPDGAAREAVNEAQAQLALSVAQNQAQVSREMLLTNPETKKYYDRYAEEVEAGIAKMTPLERFQNPRMYQTILEQVKSRHTDDIVQESLQAKIDEAVNAKLAALGYAPAAATAVTQAPGYPATARAPIPTGAGGTGQRPPQARTTVVIPTWIVDQADRQGSDPKFLYQYYKSQGRI